MIQIALLGLTPIVGRRRTKKICLLSSIFRGSCRARVKDFLLDSQITKQNKDWLYPQLIQAIKKVIADSIILVFSPTKLSNLVNY
jgi:hypothetical protein